MNLGAPRSTYRPVFAPRGIEAPPIRAPRSRHVFPAFPERQEFDIHAIDSPARVVTGDSHDFFFVTEDTLAFLIADVSGKGMSASLVAASLDADARGFRPETGFSDPHNLLRQLSREERAQVLAAAFEAHPERFKGRRPTPRPVPQAVWINPPEESP